MIELLFIALAGCGLWLVGNAVFGVMQGVYLALRDYRRR